MPRQKPSHKPTLKGKKPGKRSSAAAPEDAPTRHVEGEVVAPIEPPIHHKSGHTSGQTSDQAPGQAIVRQNQSLISGSLEHYLAEINRFPLLSRDEEFALALHYWKTGDPKAAHRLVTANLRFVVKVALQYAKFGIKLTDLIQEGNLGLMLAVKKFNPNLGNRLISYAVWWIRAYIQKHLLDGWSLVKVGTTQAQRRLFSSMKRIQRKLARIDGTEVSDKILAEALNVQESEITQMKQRLAGHDLSLDMPIGEDESHTHLDLLPSAKNDEPDEVLIRKSNQQLVQRAIHNIKDQLNEKELAILRDRLMTDEPLTLQEIGDQLQVSRERIRQIEENLKKKLRYSVEELLADGEKLTPE